VPKKLKEAYDLGAHAVQQPSRQLQAPSQGNAKG